jgi:2-iminobutanoate/2-iminopropanoate deaminase
VKKLKTIETNLAPAAIGPYSQGILAANFIFVSGQLGMHPETGELVSNEFEAQARQSLENLKNVILESGTDLSNVASVDVFLTDLKYFQTFNKIYQSYFANHKPARAVVEVSALPKGALIEIKCIACLEID